MPNKSSDPLKTHSPPQHLLVSPQFLNAASDLESDDAQQPPCLHANLLFGGDPLGTIVVEVQVHLSSIIGVKRQSHKLYQVTRAESMDELRTTSDV